MFLKQQLPKSDKQHVSQIVSRVKREHATREYNHENQPFKRNMSIMYQRSNGNINVYVFEMGNICVRFIKKGGGMIYGKSRGHTVRTALNGYDFEVPELPDNNQDLNVIFNNQYLNIWEQLEFNGFIIKDLDAANGNSYLIDNPVTMVFGVMSIRNYSNVPLPLCAICFYKLPDPREDQTLRIRGNNMFAHDRKVTEVMEVSQFEIGRFLDMTARDMIMDMLLYKTLTEEPEVMGAADGSLSVIKEITRGNIFQVNPDKLIYALNPSNRTAMDLECFLDKHFPNPFGSTEKYWNTYDRHLTAYYILEKYHSIKIRSIDGFMNDTKTYVALRAIKHLNLKNDMTILMLLWLNRYVIRKSKYKKIYFDVLVSINVTTAPNLKKIKQGLLKFFTPNSNIIVSKIPTDVRNELRMCRDPEKKWRKFCELMPVDLRRALVDWDGFDVQKMKSALRVQLNRLCHRLAVVNHNDISSNGQWMQASRVPALKQLFRF